MTQRRPPSHGKPPGQRQLRVGEQVRHALTRILREGKFRDPDLSAPEMVTVTAVELGPDLKHAHVYVMPLGGKDIDKTVAALNRAAAYMRGELGKALDLRNTPRLSFRHDHSFDAAAHIEELLEKVRREE